MSLAEVAEHLGKSTDTARKLLNRYGITEKRGYPRDKVLALKPSGQGRRTDLEKAAAKPIAETITTMRDQLAAIHQRHKDTPCDRES